MYNLGNRIVNNYLISSDGGYILIDTGYNGGFKRFMKKLKRIHVEPKEIGYVFLTHAHDDHAGFLNEVLAVTDAMVIAHPGAVEGLRRGQNSFIGGCSSYFAYIFCRILALFGHGEHRYPPIKEAFIDRIVTVDSERFKELKFPYEVIETPGHTADHISLLTGDKLFCGDAAMNGFPSCRRTIIWVEDLQQFKKSWKKITELSADTLYPGHGKPFKTEDLKKFLPSLDLIKLRPLK
ncbi:MAG: MBL fold metallo-hydrolase [Clostridia bacterium]|nr:MBL fold metallo-hydrolase [Clostridia bacterium]